MPIGQTNDKLVEVSIAHQNKTCAATINISSLFHKSQESWINKKFLITVGF